MLPTYLVTLFMHTLLLLGSCLRCAYGVRAASTTPGSGSFRPASHQYRKSPAAAASGDRGLQYHAERMVFFNFSYSWDDTSRFCRTGSALIPQYQYYDSRLFNIDAAWKKTWFYEEWSRDKNMGWTLSDVENNLLFVGLRRDPESGEWKWSNGKPLDTSIISWMPGYPVDGTGLDCARVKFPDMTLVNTLCMAREGRKMAYFICERECYISAGCEENESTCTYDPVSDSYGSTCHHCLPQHTHVNVTEDRCLDCSMRTYHGAQLIAPPNTDVKSCLTKHFGCPISFSGIAMCVKPK